MKSNDIVRAAIRLTGVSVLSKSLYYLYQVSLTHLVGSNMLGMIHLITPIYYTTLSFLTAGFAQAICRLTAENWASHNYFILNAIYSRVNRLFKILFFVILLPFCFTIVFYVRSTVHSLRLLPILVLIPFLLFCTAQEIFQKQAFYGINNLTIPSVLQITEQLVRMFAILGVLLLLPHREPTTVVFIVFAGMLVSEIYSSLHLKMLRKRQMISIPLSQLHRQQPPSETPKDILRIMLPVSITTMIGQSIGTLNANILPYLLTQSGMTYADALSAFGILCGTTIPLLTLPTSLTSSLSIILLPNLSGHRAREDASAFSHTLGFCLKLTFLLVTPLTFLLACLSPVIGRLLYHHNDMGTAILPLSLCVILSAFEDLFATALNACDRQTANATVTFLSALLQIILTIGFTPSMGMTGYVISLLLSTLLGALLRLIVLLRMRYARVDL